MNKESTLEVAVVQKPLATHLEDLEHGATTPAESRMAKTRGFVDEVLCCFSSLSLHLQVPPGALPSFLFFKTKTFLALRPLRSRPSPTFGLQDALLTGLDLRFSGGFSVSLPSPPPSTHTNIHTHTLHTHTMTHTSIHHTYWHTHTYTHTVTYTVHKDKLLPLNLVIIHDYPTSVGGGCETLVSFSCLWRLSLSVVSSIPRCLYTLHHLLA